MLKFREYTRNNNELVCEVSLTLSNGLGWRTVGAIMKEFGTTKYWMEFTEICLRSDEIEEILNKVKELNYENQ